MVSAQLKTDVSSVTLIAGFDYLTGNVKAVGDDTTEFDNVGMVAQLRVKYEGYGIRYYYYDIGEASTPFWGDIMFTQDNLPSSKNASTGITAQRAQFDYKIDKGVSADFRAYFVTGKEESKLSFAEKAKRNITRYQANLNVSF